MSREIEKIRFGAAQLLTFVDYSSRCTAFSNLTEERNRKVSDAVKKWAKTHREHYYKMGVLGTIKARELGLSGTLTSLEIKMEKALRKNKVRYLSQRRYGMGIMDFYLPEGNIALFVDGTIWHADPRIYDATDILFLGRRFRKENGTKRLPQMWKKDGKHNS